MVCGHTGYPAETYLNSNITKSPSSIKSLSVVKSFWNFVKSTALSLQCSVLCAKFSKRLGICKITYWQMRLSEIWVQDNFRTDIPYCTRPQVLSREWKYTWSSACSALIYMLVEYLYCYSRWTGWHQSKGPYGHVASRFMACGFHDIRSNCLYYSYSMVARNGQHWNHFTFCYRLKVSSEHPVSPFMSYAQLGLWILLKISWWKEFAVMDILHLR